MYWRSKTAAILGLTLLFATAAQAEPLPHLLSNFPTTQNDTVKQAYAEQFRASFPQDIRSSTLTALMEMDGFTVVDTDFGYAASFVNAEYPCITDYTIRWGESELGYVTGMQIDITHKCV